MRRKVKYVIGTILMAFFMVPSVYARVDYAEDTKLTEDVTDPTIVVKGNVIIDLNGHTINGTVHVFGNVTITGNGIIDGGNATAIWVYREGSVTLENGTIRSNASYESNGKKYDVNAVQVGAVSSGAGAGTFIMNGGTITGASYGIFVTKDSSVVINGGTIESKIMAIASNGSHSESYSEDSAKITVNGGILKSDAVGIYAPSYDGVTKITGGTIIGKETGIEIRGGSLDVTGGTIQGGAESETSSTPNGNGSTTSNAGIAIAQHTTLDDINVTISGGSVTSIGGNTALYESNPQNNSAEDIAKVTIKVTGGTFNATGANAVYSEDVSSFITGGTYSSDVTEYVANGYSVFETEDGKFVVDKTVEMPDLPEETIYINVGETYTLPELTGYARYEIADDGVLKIEKNIITGVKAGSSYVFANLGTRNGTSFGVVVTSAKVNGLDDVSKDLLDDISNVIEGNASEVKGIDQETLEKIKLLQSTDGITFDLTIDEVNGDDLTEEEKVSKAVIKNGIIAGYYNIDVLVKNGDTVLGNVTETNKELEITLELPELTAVKEGFTREYYVIRIHDGKVTIIDNVTVNDNGTVTFKSDKFSTYALAYEDVEKEKNTTEVKDEVVPPKTLDSVITYIIVTLVATALIIYTSLYLKKRFNH